MKKILSNSLLGISLLFGQMTGLDNTIKEKIIILDDAEEYLTARELLSDFITSENKIDAIKFWLKQDKKIYNTLDHGKNHLCSIDKIMQDTMEKQEQDSSMYKFLKRWFHPEFSTGLEPALSYSEKINEIEILKKCSIPLFDIQQAKIILKKYNFLKKSQDKLNYLLKETIKQSNTKEFKDLLPLLKEVKFFKNDIKQSRTNFISYTVVSPYLADAERYILLSNLDNLIGHNEEYLQKAARSMSKGAYKNLLLESNEDVREQFYMVFQKLKETAGKKEWEDLKVLQTLMDSASNLKKNGADLWWE